MTRIEKIKRLTLFNEDQNRFTPEQLAFICNDFLDDEIDISDLIDKYGQNILARLTKNTESKFIWKNERQLFTIKDIRIFNKLKNINNG